MASASGQPPSPQLERVLRSIRTMVLVASIFAILSVILDFVLLGAVASLGIRSASGVMSLNLGIPGLTLSLATPRGPRSNLLSDIPVDRFHGDSLRHEDLLSCRQGRHHRLKVVQLAWLGHSGLIFSGVIPGVLLLIAYGRIEDLPSPQS